MKKSTRNDDPAAREKAREFRREMSASESILRGYLRHKRTGFKFRRQYPAGSYFLDFFCREASLAVEVDGKPHTERQARDAARDAWLASRNIAVMRIPSLDLFEPTSLKLGQWLTHITTRCEERALRKAFPDS